MKSLCCGREEKMKITTTFAEIVVHGTKDRPYYEIMYYDMERDVMCIGYSSYYLDIVFKYLEIYFNIVKDEEKEQIE